MKMPTSKQTRLFQALPGKDVPTEWHDRTNRAVFTWQEPPLEGGTVSYEDRKSTWNSGVRKVIRLGRRSAEEEVRKHQDRLTGAWKQISKQRRRVFASYAPSMVTALQHGTWMDGEGLKKKLYQGQEKKVRHPPASLRYMGSRLHAETGCRKVFVLGMYLSDQKIPWQRRRQSRMAVAGNTQTASFLTKIGKMQSAGCRLCRIALEVRDESTDGLAAETHGPSHQQCRLRRNGNNSYGCPPLHLEAPV